jgi:hypothetical protein
MFYPKDRHFVHKAYCFKFDVKYEKLDVVLKVAYSKQ